VPSRQKAFQEQLHGQPCSDACVVDDFRDGQLRTSRLSATFEVLLSLSFAQIGRAMVN